MNIYKTTGVVLLTFLVSAGVSLGQTKNIDKVLEKTQSNIEELIIAKDENSPLDLGLRVETFKRALELSIDEAEDLKLKLLSFDRLDGEEINEWKDYVIQEINNSIEYYEGIRTNELESSSDLTLEEIQDLAMDLKEWRELNYMDVHSQGQNFLLIEKEKEALETINNRWSKINKDMNTLQRLEYINEDSELWLLLQEARELIRESSRANGDANRKFHNEYVLIDNFNDDESINDEANINESNDEAEVIDETDANEPELETQPDSLEPTIKDEIKLSLDKMREAYQIFIEMSSSVRELLS